MNVDTDYISVSEAATGGGAIGTDTFWAAKGDLAVGTANDTAAVLTVGADDTILMADALAATGLKWVASAIPSTQAFGDAADVGTADTFTRGDHKHAIPADPVTAHAAAADPHTGYLREATTVDFLVGTATAELAGEIVVGATPGGELGGTWAAPTVDATHSGTAHHTQSHAHSAAGDGTTLTPAVLNIPFTITPAQTAEGDAVWDSDGDFLTVGDGVGRQTFLPVLDATSDPLAVSTAAADGTEASLARKDHVHAHEAAHINHDTTWAAAGDIIVGTANDTAAVITKGAAGTFLQAGATTVAYANVYQCVTFSKEGLLIVGTGTIRWYNDTGRTLTIDSTRASVGTAPATTAVIVDVNIGGTTIFTTQSNRPTIAAAGNTDQGGVPDVTTIANGSYFTVDIDQIGTVTVGSDLSVQIFLIG